ncbi:MAG: hypothetical protein MR025_05520 [Helicobacter trogontum]|nr:hypothetical protein [Helicobacter trogontum]MCI5786892.1 hypothetical protein [Helicobacter trogontum]
MQNKNIVRKYIIIRIMKTFKDILLTDNTNKNKEGCIDPNTLLFLQNSYNLHLLKNFIIPQMRQYIIAITPSRRDKEELLFTFNNYPVCTEFNKFHAKILLKTIKKHVALNQTISLESYTKIKGYVPKNLLDVYQIQYVNPEDLHEYAEGNFINHATNPTLHTIFEDIRAIIKLRRKHIKNLQTQHSQDTLQIYNITDKPLW